MPEPVKILITSSADNSGFASAKAQSEALSAQIEKLSNAIEAMAKKSNSAGEALKTGLGIGVGEELLHRLQEIPNAIGEMVKEGIKFNATMESARIGVAATLTQFGGDGVRDFNHALTLSDSLLAQLRTSANKLGISLESMVEQYKTTAGSMFHGGINDLEKQVQLTTLLSQAVAATGAQGFTATRDVQDILLGLADRTKAGRELGINDADVNRAKANGTLFEFLTEKLSAYTAASDANSQTLNSQIQRFENLKDQLLGITTGELFEQLRNGIEQVNTAMGKDSASVWAAGIGGAAGSAVQSIAGVVQGLAQVWKYVPDVTGLSHLGKPFADQFEASGDLQRQTMLNTEALGFRDKLKGAQDEAATKKVIEQLDSAIAIRRDEQLDATGHTAEQLAQQVKWLTLLKSQAPGLMGTAEQLEGTEHEDAKAAKKRITREIAQDRSDAAIDRAAAAADAGLEETPASKAADLEATVQQMRQDFANDLNAARKPGLPSHPGEAFKPDFSFTSAADALKDLNDQTPGSEGKATHDGLAHSLENLISLTKSLTAARKAADSADSSEAKKKASAEATIQDMREQLTVEQELVAGNDTKAAQLKIEHQLHKDIAGIEKSDMTPAQKQISIELKSQTAELAKQKVLNDDLARTQKKRATDLQPDLSAAKEKGGKGATARHNARAQFIAEGGDGDDFDAQMRAARGRFGGHAHAADPSGNLTDSPDTDHNIRSGFDILKPPTPRDDLPDLAPSRHHGDGMETHGAQSLDNAAQKLDGGAQKTEAAAQKLTNAAEQLGAAADQFGTTGDALATQAQQMASSLANLEARVSNLESNPE